MRCVAPETLYSHMSAAHSIGSMNVAPFARSIGFSAVLLSHLFQPFRTSQPQKNLKLLIHYSSFGAFSMTLFCGSPVAAMNLLAKRLSAVKSDFGSYLMGYPYSAISVDQSPRSSSSYTFNSSAFISSKVPQQMDPKYFVPLYDLTPKSYDTSNPLLNYAVLVTESYVPGQSGFGNWK